MVALSASSLSFGRTSAPSHLSTGPCQNAICMLLARASVWVCVCVCACRDLVRVLCSKEKLKNPGVFLTSQFCGNRVKKGGLLLQSGWITKLLCKWARPLVRMMIISSCQLKTNKYVWVGINSSSLWMFLCRATPTNPLLTIMLPGSHKKKKKQQQLQPQLLIVANYLLTTNQFRKACDLLRKKRRNGIQLLRREQDRFFSCLLFCRQTSFSAEQENPLSKASCGRRRRRKQQKTTTLTTYYHPCCDSRVDLGFAHRSENPVSDLPQFVVTQPHLPTTARLLLLLQQKNHHTHEHY